MNATYLEFEKPIADLQARIEELRTTAAEGEVNLDDDIARLEHKCAQLTDSIFAKLTPVQIAQLARHADRPYTLDYVSRLFTDFIELHGDRAFADDAAIVGGPARFNGRPVMLIGQQKGRDTREKVRRNFGMPRPEGYRKAQRLMRTAERFGLPVVTFIDTPGAYPGVDAEERGQSRAIAENLYLMSQLRVPILCVVIGEGGSGGALAIGMGDRVLMLRYATYSVISPEGCAAILWKDNSRADAAAQALGITADRLAELGLIDDVVQEPPGGAHRDPAVAADTLATAIEHHLAELCAMDIDQLLQQRHERLDGFGAFQDREA